MVMLRLFEANEMKTFIFFLVFQMPLSMQCESFILMAERKRKKNISELINAESNRSAELKHSLTLFSSFKQQLNITQCS